MKNCVRKNCFLTIAKIERVRICKEILKLFNDEECRIIFKFATANEIYMLDVSRGSHREKATWDKNMNIPVFFWDTELV